MKHLFENYKVMIWTSSQPQTTREILNKILSRKQRQNLVAIWARDTLGLTKQQYCEKTQVYKRLDKVWDSKEIQAKYPVATQHTPGPEKVGKADDGFQHSKRNWDQTNTVLIDDSQLKGIGQPHNIIVIPEFTNDRMVDEVGNLTTVMRQLRILSRQEDVSRKLREWKELRERKLITESEPGKQPHVDLETQYSWDSELERDEQLISTLCPLSFLSPLVGEDEEDANVEESAAEPQVSPDKELSTTEVPNAGKRRRKRGARRGAISSDNASRLKEKTKK
jgi:hypothetical protein